MDHKANAVFIPRIAMKREPETNSNHFLQSKINALHIMLILPLV